MNRVIDTRFQDSDDTDDSDYDLEELRGPVSMDTTKKETEGIIHQLIRISIAVRRAGSQARVERADSSFQPDRHGELLGLLTVLLYASTSTTGSRLEGCAERNPFSFQPTEVQSRLILANLRRRHRFLYAEKRWKKQGREHNASMAEGGMLYSGPQRNERAVIEGKTQEDEPMWSRSAMEAAPTPTSTAPTTIREPVAVPESSQPSMTLASATGAKVSYPSAPDVSDGHQAFTCPCCYLSLPVSLSEGRKWRLALINDWALFIDARY